ncbi:phage major tail tube protein [Laribacter hongkongensis]|uniref:Phage contractile tail tube protein, P2 family n=1 Tax=Laribacter hongkongensis TaxID=168471 RepID=A0A248LIY7_9NEIS|nr:phage major tail tube protein [Laribacter hongkongensis]ASJ24326.1 phage contractile tail tube protein, P2 family [Laribacter hongkongensis]MCG9042007.1 phage major tail tube protein [Laribacter hongkongensis]MCG9068989.1 phage major tail tube protein [Laribacter hongkongensis]MCG9087729.1 phage major tail tube protein [Laribacter hongkongensis]MCG9110844.1 phage major tail tube protein [Laribacter hongkongensis]
MAMPNTLKMFNLFGDGNSFIDTCLELKLPKIAMKVEEYTGAGMLGPVALLKGLEKIEFEHTYNCAIDAIVQSFGAEKHDAALLRFMGSYSDEGSGGDRAVEITVRGRHNELDFGDAKANENGNWKVKTDCTYYKLVIDGKEWLEIDVVNKIFKVMGTDRLAQHRKNIGL